MEVMRRRSGMYSAALKVVDSQQNVETQIEAARKLIPDVDALILTPVATTGPEVILEMATERGIPVVVEANPLAGMQTMIAICDYDAGVKVGRWVGEYAGEYLKAPLKVLDIALPWLHPCLLRSEGFADGLRSVNPDARVMARVNGEAIPAVAKRQAVTVLQDCRAINVIFAMDDESAEGGLEGYLECGLDPKKVVVAGFGLSGDKEKDLLMQGAPLKVSAAMFPEYVAVQCVDQLFRLCRGERVRRHQVTPTLAVSSSDLSKYYRKSGGQWCPDLKAVASLPVEGTCSKE